ncbi:hypothetical protein ACMFMG_005508 [Clarireedia jacksonii]
MSRLHVIAASTLHREYEYEYQLFSSSDGNESSEMVRFTVLLEFSSTYISAGMAGPKYLLPKEYILCSSESIRPSIGINITFYPTSRLLNHSAICSTSNE